MDLSGLDQTIMEGFEDDPNWEFDTEMDDKRDLIAKSNIISKHDAPKKDHLEVLSRCFGHKSFRPLQWNIISSIINGQRDNCSIMATGYGKSLCYQYPSVYCGGLTIVVSPLISLMEDQVLSLKVANISACLLGSAQTKQKQVIQEIFDNKYSLVYVTPEFCCGDYGVSLLKRMYNELHVVLLAIDEAHCVSSWGHDFRKQYRQLSVLRTYLPTVPILAVTATATKIVREDIIRSLHLKNPQFLCSSFDRPNLYFSVFLKTSDIFQDLKKLMILNREQWSFPGSTIIYCITRKQTTEVAELLKLKNIKCAQYHAGMSNNNRKEAHEQFVRDQIKVVVATIAFGMGIDKPDVRMVIHYGAPKDLESYYQEVGRAGRDGQDSKCITFYSNGDFIIHAKLRDATQMNERVRASKEQGAQKMRQYLDLRECRRAFILNHFEGEQTNTEKKRSNCCDNCTRKLTQNTADCDKYEGIDNKGLYDFTTDAFILLSAVNALGGKFGIGMYILLIRGSRSSKLHPKWKKHQLYGAGKHQVDLWWKGLARLLEGEKYLQKTALMKGGFHLGTYHLTPHAEHFIAQQAKSPGNATIIMSPTAEMFKLLTVKKPTLTELESTTNILPKPQWKTAPTTSTVSKASTSQATSQGSNKKSETDLEKSERMNVYRMLINKRGELASSLDCMPYMVASNEALMKMAQYKPLTISELRDYKLDGFTEAKIGKFGDEFVKTIRAICKLNPVETSQTKRSIEDILTEHPLPNCSIRAAAQASYSMYKAGLTVQEIAVKRGIIMDTALAHLIDAIQVGYPVKLIDLNVTDEIRDLIIDRIRNVPNDTEQRLTAIKNLCPPDVTVGIIKIVMAYLKVRDHLAELNIPYEDFEFPGAVQIESKMSQMNNNLDVSTDDFISDEVQPVKKIKLNESKTTLQKRINFSALQKSTTSEAAESNLSLFDDDLFDDFNFDSIDQSVASSSKTTTTTTTTKRTGLSLSTTTRTGSSLSTTNRTGLSPPTTNRTGLSRGEIENVVNLCDDDNKSAKKKFQFKNTVPLITETTIAANEDRLPVNKVKKAKYDLPIWLRK